MSDNRNGRDGRDNRDDPPDVDRGGSIVSGPTRRQLTTAQKLGIAGLLVVIFLGVIWIQQLTRSGHPKKQQEIALSPGATNFRAAPIVLPPAPAAIAPLPVPREAPRPSLPAPQRHEMTPAESPIFAFSGGGETAGPAAAVASALAPSAASQSHEASSTSLTARLRPTVLTGNKASMLPHPDMLVTKGTMIPCTLQTAINTELPGYVKCVLPQDVRGTTGNVVLLDRGTTLVGEVQTGLMQGQDRVFVIWDRAETPDHAIVELDSPGSDQLGRAGVPGMVNNHFLQRYGSAILLTLVQGVVQAGSALAANSNNGTNGFSLNSFQSNGNDIANTALQNSINIPPTLEVNQGDNTSVFVARDLDFSDVYRLRVISAYDGGR